MRTSTRTIGNDDDIIDSRDVIARIEELEEDRDTFVAALSEAQEEYDDIVPSERDESHVEALEKAQADLDEWDESDEGRELKALKALAEEGEQCADWKHGETLIRDSYFEDHARELAEDIGAVGRDMQWPLQYIDWERAADALKMDYTSIDFDGVTYWARS